MPNYVYSQAKVDHVVSFFRDNLSHVEGEWAGQPFELVGWQIDVVEELFGWLHTGGPRRGKRKNRRLYLEIAKKMGKTTFTAGLALYFLCADGENRPLVLVFAGSHDQAKVLFEVCQDMVDASDTLRELLEVTKTEIRYLAKRGVLKIKSSLPRTSHGPSATCTIIDELHCQADSSLFKALRGAGSSRSQPMLITLTTAGDKKEHIWWSQRTYAKSVIDGQVEDDELVARIYAAEQEDDWRDENVWLKANPALGITVDIQTLRQEAREAESDPELEANFRRLRLNQYVGDGLSFFAPAWVEHCHTDVDLESLAATPCVAGIDIGVCNDFSAFTLYWRPTKRRPAVVIAWFFYPGEDLELKEKRDHAPYGIWASRGYITLNPGPTTDQDVMLEQIKTIGEYYEIESIAVDPHLFALAAELQEAGFEVIEVPQNRQRLSGSVQELKRLILEKRITFRRNPVMVWMLSNAKVVVYDDGMCMLAKKRSATRVDGVSALLTAMARTEELDPPDEDDGDERTPAGVRWSRPAGKSR